MDKFYLLTYTCTGFDGFYHLRHAWFDSEEELRGFVEECRKKGKTIEIELAIEILDCRMLSL